MSERIFDKNCSGPDELGKHKISAKPVELTVLADTATDAVADGEPAATVATVSFTSLSSRRAASALIPKSEMGVNV